METFTYTVDGKEFELKHYGVKGMKWGKRKARYVPVGNTARRSSQSATDSPEAQAARKEARRQKAVRAAKIGAAVVGTALAAYGTYKLAQHLQNKRNSAAMQKAQDFINKNTVHRVEHTRYTDGTQSQTFRNIAGNFQFQQYKGGADVSKVAGRHNADVAAEARRMYQKATSTGFDRGLSKIVNAGDAVGTGARRAASATKSAAEKAASATKSAAEKAVSATKSATHKAATQTKNAAHKAKNSILDKVNPQYEYTPQIVTRTRYDAARGQDVTKEYMEYIKRQKKRR